MPNRNISISMKTYLRLIMLFSSLRVTISVGQRFQYYLDIYDLLDPAWVYSEFSSVNSKIQCATLCYQDQGRCSYFGYKEKICYLLKDTVDELSCSKDDCSNTGMKVYKWKADVPTTAKTAETTTTSRTATSEAEITTTGSGVTTTKAAGIKTETEAPTSEEQTTSTKAETTTTEARPATTEGQTTETEVVSTTTETTPADLGTTSVMEATTISKTTIEPTTTEGGFVCDLSNNAVETEGKCAMDTQLVYSLSSRMQFFSDILVLGCTELKEKLYSDNEEIFVFYSNDGGISIAASCPEETQVIVKLKICVKDNHVPVITLHCNHILEEDRIENVYTVTSMEPGGMRVTCEEESAIQKIDLMDYGNGVHTRVNFTCVKLHVEGESIGEPAPPPGGP